MLPSGSSARAALAESERRYRLLAENTTDTIIMCDAQMKRRYVSPSVTNPAGLRAG